MSSVGDTPIPPNPEDQKLYKQEYVHGLDLFQRALEQHAKAEEVHKKAAFEEVMERALQVLNDTARGLKREDLQSQNQQIGKDLKAYEDKSDDATRQALAKDLQRAKDSIG